MAIEYFPDLIQGGDEWFAARCGLLTASEMHLIISPPPKPETRIKKNGEPYKQREWSIVSDDDDTRAHVYELLGQRISQYVEPTYIGDDMLRGKEDEVLARILYEERYAPVRDMGFITNDKWGFKIGYSPDGLVGDGGLIEAKSRRQKHQVRTIIECVIKQAVPDEHLIQVQTGLLVSEREWCDFISYGGGWPMATIRAETDRRIQDAIVEAATAFEKKLADKWAEYREALASGARLIPTERRVQQEMYV